MVRKLAIMITGAMLITMAVVLQVKAATEFVSTIKASDGDARGQER